MSVFLQQLNCRVQPVLLKGYSQDPRTRTCHSTNLIRESLDWPPVKSHINVKTLHFFLTWEWILAVSSLFLSGLITTEEMEKGGFYYSNPQGSSYLSGWKPFLGKITRCVSLPAPQPLSQALGIPSTLNSEPLLHPAPRNGLAMFWLSLKTSCAQPQPQHLSARGEDRLTTDLFPVASCLALCFELCL